MGDGLEGAWHLGHGSYNAQAFAVNEGGIEGCWPFVVVRHQRVHQAPRAGS